MSNILPKKSWHVLNADNQERVRRDEEGAEEANKARQEAHAQHERMSRFEELKRRAGSQNHHSEAQHLTQQVQDIQARCDDWGSKRSPSNVDCHPPRQRDIERSPFRRTPQPWYEYPDKVCRVDQEASLAREDPLTLFKKKTTRPSSSSYMAVQKAKERKAQKPRPK